MTIAPMYSNAGSEKEKIDVRLSYGIVRLFSEGLYASPNKAIEELVANSFDAGALRVSVLLPADFNEQGATIAVIDDGEGMDNDGLKTHWLIGKSLKRALAARPLGRQQIGRFGIGKLAT
jgi:HSP90 family molecular chaperone